MVSDNKSLPAGLGRLGVFVVLVSIAGAAVLAHEWNQLSAAPLNAWALVLAILTVVSGRFIIKVPGQPATVTVSEVFIFSSVLLFGPAPATITVALDGLWTSVSQEQRRIYRALFNIAEPAISTFVAGTIFFWIARTGPFWGQPPSTASLTLAAIAMSATYFLLNSVLQATAVALESGAGLWTIWRPHALYLGLNYYAAGSLATLAVKNAYGFDLDIIGLVGPLLFLSYGAYKAAASRIDDAHRHIGEVEHLYGATVEMMAIAVDAKDQVTHGHIRRVQRHTVAVAKTLGVTDERELKALEAASLLHDIGKLAVPDYVLNKPGALTHAEFETMKLHASVGASILSTVDFPYPIVPIVRHHHEQWCGKGYPDGLAGEAIPLGARILSVVDCLDAVTSDRPYRRKMTDEEAFGILRSRSGVMYDPRVVEAFIALVPELRRADREAEANMAQGPIIEPVHGGSVDRLPGSSASPLGKERQLDRVESIILTGLRGLSPRAEACFFVHAEDANSLSAVRATPGLRDETAVLRVPVGEGLAAWVASNRYSIVNSNADLDLGAPAARRLGLSACAAVPVFALGKLVGVLSVYLPEGQKFSDDDVSTVGLVAQDIGSALVQDERQRRAPVLITAS